MVEASSTQFDTASPNHKKIYDPSELKLEVISEKEYISDTALEEVDQPNETIAYVFDPFCRVLRRIRDTADRDCTGLSLTESD
jgi:hypothetical protein